MAVGDVVCMAGASPMKAAVKPGVRCGEITEKPDGGIRTNICAKRGDSGSPLSAALAAAAAAKGRTYRLVTG